MFLEERYINSLKYQTRDMLKAEMLCLYMNNTKVFTCISTVDLCYMKLNVPIHQYEEIYACSMSSFVSNCIRAI